MSGQLPEPHRNSGPSNNAAHARAIAQGEATAATKGTLQKDPAPIKSKASMRLVLDLKAIEEAKRILDQGAVTPHYGPWRNDIIELLNDSLATELICSLRYRRHHFTAEGLSSPKIAEEFLAHANEEMAHADMIAKRIVELGGTPDFAPDSLTRRSHAGYDESKDLTSMITANLIAERVAIESYSQMIALIGDKDSTTRRMIEEILAVEQSHAEELRDWLAN
jgi:bacterioferritin